MRQQPRYQLNARSRPLPAVIKQHENKGHQNETEYFFGERPVPSPAATPTPVVRLRPPHYADFPDLLFALGQHGSVIDQRGSTSGAVASAEYVDNGETEAQIICDLYDCDIEMAHPMGYSSFPQRLEEEGNTMDEQDSSAYYNVPLHVMNTKDHDNWQQDQSATESTEGCNKEQLGPYDTKEKLLDWTPAAFPPAATSGNPAQTSIEVTLTPLDDGPLYMASASGTILTAERFDCVCCHTPLRVSLLSSEQAIVCFKQHHQVASQRRRTTTRNGDDVCLIGSMATDRTPVGDVWVRRVQRKSRPRTSPSAVTRSASRSFFKTTVTYTASASSPGRQHSSYSCEERQPASRI